MKKNYDFSKGIKNPYAKQLKLQKEQRKEEKGDMKRKTLACLILVMALCSTMYVQDGNASAKNNVVTLRGIKKGNCVITAKCGGKKYRIRVTVKPKKKIPMGTIYGTAVNYKISMTDNLEIRLESKGTKTYYYGLEPGILERKSGNKWVQLKQKQDIAWIDIAYVLSGNQKQILSVPIHSYYEGVIPGQYRYTKAIGKENVTVMFEIVN